MGVLDWIDDALDATGGALAASPGVTWDFIKPGGTGDQWLNKAWDETFEFVRPGGGGDQLINRNVPGGRVINSSLYRGTRTVTDPAGTYVVKPVMSGLAWTRKNVLSHPLAAAIRAVQEDPLAGIKGPFDRPEKTTQELWRETESVSPGQQLAAPIGALYDDVSYHQAIKDPNQFADEAWFNYTSGTVDFIAAVTLDPAIIAGKTLAVARQGILVRPATAGDVESRLRSPGINRFVNWVLENQGKPDKIARNPALRRTAAGEGIAVALANAGDAETVKDLLRVAIEPPNGPAYQKLSAQRVEIADILDQLEVQREDLLELAYRNTDGVGSVDDLSREMANKVKASLKAWESRDHLLANMQEFAGTLRRSTPGAPGQNLATDLRHRWFTQDVVQRNWFTSPVAFVRSFQDRRLGLVRYHDQNAGRHVDEFLKRVPNLDPAERSRLVGRAMASRSEQELEDALIAAEKVAMRRVAEKHGLTVDMAEDIYRTYSNKRTKVFEAYNMRQYSAVKTSEAPNADTIDVFVDPHTGEKWNAALIEPQLRNTFALIDVDRIDKVLTRHGHSVQRAMRRGDAAEVVEQLQTLWKMSVLWRFGYTLRVLGDDQARLFVRYGALASLVDLEKGAVNLLRNQATRISEADKRRRRGAPLFHREGVARYFPGAQADEVLLDRNSELAERIGDASFEVNGVNVPGPFQNVPEYRDLVSANNEYVEFVRGTEASYLAAARQLASKSGWETITYSSTNKAQQGRYFAAWRQAINDQLANSQIAQRLIAGETPEQVTRWLSGPGGRALRRRIPTWGHDPEDWVQRVNMMVESYIPPHLREKALKGSVTRKDLEDAMVKPPVHGGTIQYNLGDHGLNLMFDEFTRRSMRLLNGLPTDILSRQPAFARAYRHITADLVEEAQRMGVQITDSFLGQISRNARRQAMKETKELLFDISSSSQFAHSIRLLAPFAGAWQDTLAVWLKLSMEAPHRIARLGVAFDAPARGGVYVNEFGEEIESEGTPRLPKEGEFIQFRLPEWAHKSLGLGIVKDVTLGSKSLNLVLQGDPVWLPAAGPLVQIPVNELLIRTRPELAEAIPFILPFGVRTADTLPERIVQQLTPAAFNKAIAADPESALDPNTPIRIWQGEYVKFLNGERPKPPTWAEIEGKARSFNALKAVVGFFQPGTVQLHAEGKVFLDEWRRLVNENKGDKTKAEQQFFEHYGSEFWPFIASVSKNNTGIPATVNAIKASRKYSDLIAKHPEFGGLIIGPEGAGSFSSNAYNHQLRTPVGPGSDTTFREKQSPQESIDKALLDAGWHEYSKAMNLLDTILFERGLTSYQQKGAEDLQAYKQHITLQIADKYVDGEGKQVWYRDYQQRDTGAIAERIEGLRTLSQVPELMNNPLRTDIKTLQEYFRVRVILVSMLLQRAQAGYPASLQARANQDIAMMWEHIKGVLVERDPMFAGLFHRYLESDNLQFDPILSTVPVAQVG